MTADGVVRNGSRSGCFHSAYTELVSEKWVNARDLFDYALGSSGQTLSPS